MDNPTPGGTHTGQFHSRAKSASDESFPRAKSGLLVHALAGLEAGIVGVIWMFGCFVVAAFWSKGGIWSVPNLFSTVFYREYAYDGGFFRGTLAGVALIVVLYGLIAALWGCFWKEDRKALLSFFGALTGIAVYFFFFDFVWPHLDPLIPLYAPVRQIEVAHILWGAALARSPVYSRRIASAIMQPTLAEPGFADTRDTPGVKFIANATVLNPDLTHAAPSQDDAESVSGELIQ